MIDADLLNNWSGFFGFKRTKVFDWLIHCPCKIICLYTGNQFGKNETVAMDYNLRVLGIHPQAHKNVMPDDTVRIFRFASQTLPAEKSDTEVRNTQYPVMKKRMPPMLLKKDITARKPVVTVQCPDGAEVQFEYVSFSQEVQSGAGVQRRSIWIDEECSKDFYDEQIPRLMAADGDIIFSFTPVPGAIGWEFDELYERARIIYRTEAVRQRIKERTGETVPEVQYTDSSDDIAVIMAATDDNPIYEELAKKKSKLVGRTITAKDYIDSLFGMYDDEDVIDARRYGLFRQLSGKIYKSFSVVVHVISYEKYFPEGIPFDWKHFRGIDYHKSNPWAVVWISVSPQNEIFVWCEYAPSPGKMITYDIALNIAQRSGDFKYSLDLIDPLAKEKQINTNLSTVEDLNRYFYEFKKQGLCTGGYFQSWDTKGTRGREELTARLINSTKVGKPFNNKVIEDGRTVFLPTIWFTENCRGIIESMKNWRLEEWKSREALFEKDAKESPTVRWSHFPITIECLLKNPMITSARWGGIHTESLKPKRYFRQVY